MNTVVVVLNQDASTHGYQLFLIEMSISSVIMLFIIAFIVITRHMVKNIVREAKKEGRSEAHVQKI